LTHRAEFLEHPFGLGADVALDERATGRVEVDLAGTEDELAGGDRLAVRPNSRRGVLGGDGLTVHVVPPARRSALGIATAGDHRRRYERRAIARRGERA